MDKDTQKYIDRQFAALLSKLNPDLLAKQSAPVQEEAAVEKKAPVAKPSSPYSLYVATPTLGGLKYNYFHSALRLINECTARGINASFGVAGDCSLVHISRNILMRWFLDGNWTHILMIDDDIGWDTKDVFKMMESGHDFIVGAVPMRRVNKDLAAYRLKNGGNLDVDKHLSVFNVATVGDSIKVDSDGTASIDYAGTAFMMVTRKAIEKIIANGVEEYQDNGKKTLDLFGMYIDPEKRDYVGEDVAFCRRARKAGIDIRVLLDATLTHYGPTEFKGNFKDVLE